MYESIYMAKVRRESEGAWVCVEVFWCVCSIYMYMYICVIVCMYILVVMCVLVFIPTSHHTSYP